MSAFSWLVVALVAASAGVLGFFASRAVAAWNRNRKLRLANERQRELCRHLFANRPKLPIVGIGRVIATPDGRMVAQDWTFGRGDAPCVGQLFDGEQNVFLIGGWTLGELAYIAAAPGEFVDLER